MNKGWRLSPPNEDYWGENSRIATSSQRLVVDFPEHDKEVVSKISSDLDDALNRMCEVERAAECPSEFQLKVEFSRDPGSLLSVTEQFVDLGPLTAAERETGDAPALVLPTPSLLGLPAGDTSYQAMLEGNGLHVVSAILSAMPGYVCCEAEAEHGAALQFILAESGLLSWPELAERPIPDSYVNSDYGIDVYCSDGFDNGASRYHFEPVSGDWNYLRSHNKDTVSKVVPARNGFIVQESE
jgi:hypothetical protein